MLEKVKEVAPKAALWDILRWHIAGAYAAGSTNARYVAQAEKRLGQVHAIIHDGQGEVGGIANCWTDDMIFLVNELFNDSLTIEDRDILTVQ
jgi:hypothetical protein